MIARLPAEWPRIGGGLPLVACLVIALQFVTCAAAARAADDEPIGFVMDISGTWTIEGQKSKLAGGDKLPAGVTLVPQQPGPKTFIIVCLYSGEAVTYRERTLVPSKATSSWTDRIWGIVQGHFRGGVVHAVSRGDGVDDGVARIDGQRLKIAALLKHLPPGTHLLRFTPVNRSGDASTANAATPLVLTVDWQGETDLELDAKGLKAGLYQVHVLNKRSKQPTGAQATVLVAASEDFDELSQMFSNAVELTRAWDDATRAKAAPAFLAAYLNALAHTNTP